MPGDVYHWVVWALELPLPGGAIDQHSAWRDVPNAHEAGILGDGDRKARDLVGGQRHPVLRLLPVPRVRLLRGITAHQERAGWHVAQRQQVHRDVIAAPPLIPARGRWVGALR